MAETEFTAYRNSRKKLGNCFLAPRASANAIHLSMPRPQASYAFALAKGAALVGVVSPAPLLAVVYAVDGGALTDDDP